VTADAVRDSIKLRVDTGVDKVEGQVPFTPRAKKALELALREALGLGHNYIGTEHVLLGILREGDNTALEILHDDFDLTDEQIRNEVIRMLSGKAAPILTKGVDSHPFQAGQEETEFKLFTKEEVVQRRQVQEVQSKLDELKKRSELRDLLVDAANLARQYPDRDPQRIAAAVLAMS
jgi:ATP-dependent Clp protease ATP-binding subunit ClpA